MIPLSLCYRPGLFHFRTNNIPNCQTGTNGPHTLFSNQDLQHTQFSHQIDIPERHSPAFAWLMTGITTGTISIGSGGVKVYD